MPTVEEIKEIAVPILKKAGIRRAGLFGSAARGDIREESDIDILIEPDAASRFSLFDLAGLKIDLEDAFKRKVDLVDYRVVKPRLRDSILEDEVAIL